MVQGSPDDRSTPAVEGEAPIVPEEMNTHHHVKVRSLCLRRWSAKFHQHAIAQPLGIALAGFRESHDSLCENVVCQIAAIGKPKGYQSHFKREAHDADSLRVEFLPVQVRSDRQVHPRLQAANSPVTDA
jgi:hypothetical protein